MLFDPPKKQLDLPAALVDLRDSKCRKCEVVGQELEPFPGFDIEIAHAPQCLRIDLRGVDRGENDGMIGPDAGGFVHRARVATLEQNVGLGADDEERSAEREDVKALEIHIAAVHDVEAPASGRISSRMLTSCTLPSVMLINVGILPCRSSRVCIFTAALCLRNFAHGNNDRHRSMVVESRAYRLWSNSTAIGSQAYNGRAIPIRTCAKSA